MEEPYAEGIAGHGDPESCVVVRKDDGEALTGAHAGTALSRESRHSGVPTLLSEAEGHTCPGRYCESRRDPSRRRPVARVEPSCARTGRPLNHPSPMVGRVASERPEAATR